MNEKAKKRVRTPVGKELAKLRIDLDETTGIMAGKLGVHAVHLSKVEGGLAAFSIALAAKVKEVYGVDLSHMVNEGRKKITFNVDELSPEDRETILAIHAKLKSAPVEKAAAAPIAAPFTKVAEVPDVSGVDFIDDLDSLDDLE